MLEVATRGNIGSFGGTFGQEAGVVFEEDDFRTRGNVSPAVVVEEDISDNLAEPVIVVAGVDEGIEETEDHDLVVAGGGDDAMAEKVDEVAAVDAG